MVEDGSTTNVGMDEVSPTDAVWAVVLTWDDQMGYMEPAWSADLCAFLAEKAIQVKEDLYDNFIDTYLNAEDAFEGLFLFRTAADAEEFVRQLKKEGTHAYIEVKKYACGYDAILDYCPYAIGTFWHIPSGCWVVRYEKEDEE